MSNGYSCGGATPAVTTPRRKATAFPAVGPGTVTPCWNRRFDTGARSVPSTKMTRRRPRRNDEGRGAVEVYEVKVARDVFGSWSDCSPGLYIDHDKVTLLIENHNGRKIRLTIEVLEG